MSDERSGFFILGAGLFWLCILYLAIPVFLVGIMLGWNLAVAITGGFNG